MGVHGLTTFLKERRVDLSKIIIFPPQDGRSTPLVVDGWSFIYKVLEDSGLPWVYGGEYEEFAEVVLKVVRAWIAVRLRPVFVFDGSTPAEKFCTAVQRLNESHVQQALLFFRTSTTSRNTRRFLNETRIIPPLALAVCVHALLSFRDGLANEADNNPNLQENGTIEIHFADEEADPYAVELAGRLGAYVTGRDSDFVVLNSEGYLGYVPLEEMTWLASDDNIKRPVSEEINDGFQSVKKKKRVHAERTIGTGIIPPDSTELALSVSLYTPSILAQHLDLSVSVLPLLGALVGNDYTLLRGDRPPYGMNPKSIQALLFNRRFTYSQRITHASATLNTLLHGQSGKRKQKRPKSVMELIEMTVSTLALTSGAPSVLVGPDQQAAIVETVVEGTLPYAMPSRPSEDTILSSAVCALHLPHECRLVAQMDRAGIDGFPANADTISALYLSAYRQGKISPSLMDIFSTGTFWPVIFLENPDAEAVARSISRRVREFAYALLEDGAVIPAPPTDEDENQAELGADVKMEDPDELIDVMEETEDEYDDKDDISSDVSRLRDELKQLQFDGGESDKAPPSLDRENCSETNSVGESSAPGSSVRSPVPLHRQSFRRRRAVARRKVVVEYVRRGARVVAEEVEVGSLRQLRRREPDGETPETIPLQLRSSTVRMNVLCQFLCADLQDMLDLCQEDRMPVLALRLVIHRMHQRAEEAPSSKEKQAEKWTRKEARAFLSTVCRPAAESLQAPTEISERSVQLTAQVLTALECIEHVVQVLFLTDEIPGCAHRFSGLRFHSLLAANEQADVPNNVWHAIAHGSEACFSEMRPKKKSRRKAQTTTWETKTTVNARGKMTITGSLYTVLADISS